MIVVLRPIQGRAGERAQGSIQLLHTTASESEHTARGTPYLLGDRAFVVREITGHGLQRDWSITAGLIAADPQWRAIPVHDWGGGAQGAAAVAANGGALVTAGGDQESPPGVRVESYGPGA